MKLRTSAFALVVAAMAIAGCDVQSGTKPQSEDAERIGKLKAALTLPDDTEITEVHFEITHPSGFVGPGPNGLPPNEASPRTGDVPVNNSTILTFRIGNLLVQDGYTLHLTAETSFGGTCESTNTFDIADNGTTLLNVVLECEAQDNTGDLIVNGEFQTCPLVTALQAIPAEVTLGNDIELQAWISHGDSDVAWSGPGGDFSDDIGYTTVFTCETAGSHTLTASIANLDGPLADCDDSATVDVICTLGAGCGNGALDSGEDCDDGNNAAGDDCTPTCRVNVCGDDDQDLLGPDTEGCDDGNSVTEGCAYAAMSCTVCDATCEEVAGDTDLCGDSTTDAPNETCDDGNTVTEECPVGSPSCTVCDATCHSGSGDTDVCGDGTTDAGEGCDDGNTVSGDGCSATCTLEVDTCAPCRATNCQNWQGFSGWDVFHGCLDAARPSAGATARDTFGADLMPSEMTFVQQCIDAVTCARTTNCAYGAAAGTDGVFAACYCGSRNATDCLNLGPAADANTVSCRAQWEVATRQTATAAVFGASGELALPAGWAFELLTCSRQYCTAACDNIP